MKNVTSFRNLGNDSYRIDNTHSAVPLGVVKKLYNNGSIWIFIPGDVQITTDKMQKIVDFMKSKEDK